MRKEDSSSSSALPQSASERAELETRAERFTRGPWHSTIEHDDGVCVYVYTLDGVLYESGEIAVCYNTPDGIELARANARLISAAPEMYAAIDRMLGQIAVYGHINRHHESVELAIAALRKATGTVTSSHDSRSND